MRRWLTIAWAEVRCWFWLLFVGMWMGACKMKLWTEDGKLDGIYAVKVISIGGFLSHSQLIKQFYRNERGSLGLKK